LGIAKNTILIFKDKLDSFMPRLSPSTSILSATLPLAKPRFAHILLFALGTFLLLVLVTQGEIYLVHLPGTHRPYTIFYLIPVAIGAALLGVRGGIVTALASVVLARVFLFGGHEHGAARLLTAPVIADDIEFGALLLGTLTIACVTGFLRTALGDVRAAGNRITGVNKSLAESNEQLASANARLLETEQERRIFHRDVMMAVTGGKLRLVEPDEMPPLDMGLEAADLTVALEEPQDASALRRTLQKLGQERDMAYEQVADLCTGVTEAATNAVKHGHGGTAQVWTRPDAIIVQINDRGEGIAPDSLARATLDAGYSTRKSLGMGFFLMLQTSDTLVLCTSGTGTSILLRVSVKPPAADPETLMARYIGIV